MFQRSVAPGIEIRQFELIDSDRLFNVANRNRAYLREWMPWMDATRTTDDTRHFILRTIAQRETEQGPQCGIWIDGELSGSIGCHPIDWANRNCSIGYWVDAAQQGKGIVTRCVVTLLDYLFEELRLHRVEIRCGTGNYKSCAIPERLGFVREGIARGSEWVNGRWLDLVVWGMLEDEWRSAGSHSRFRERATPVK